MSEQDELRDLWDHQPPCNHAKGEDVIVQVQKRIKSFDRVIKQRNLTECIAGALVGLIFAAQAFRANDAFTRVGSLVIAAGAGWIVFYILRFGQTTPGADPTENLSMYAQSLLARYDHQIRLLKSAKLWYLLPMYVGLLIISAGPLLQGLESHATILKFLTLPASYTAIFAAILWLNEISAVRQLRKERDKLLSMTAGE